MENQAHIDLNNIPHDAIFAEQEYTDSMAPEQIKALFCAPVLLLNEYIHRFAPTLHLEPTYKPIHIVIAGADKIEATGFNQWHLLPLINPRFSQHQLVIHLVGNRYGDIDMQFMLNPKYETDNVMVRTHRGSIAEYLEDISPHMVCLNHPGFNVNAYLMEWLEDGEMYDWIANTTVVGCSFGMDEAFYDQVFAQAVGLRLSQSQENSRGLLTMAGNSEYMRWAGMTWHLDCDSCELDPNYLAFGQRLIKRSNRQTDIFGVTGKYRGLVTIDEYQFYWVCGNVFYAEADEGLYQIDHVGVTDMEIDTDMFIWLEQMGLNLDDISHPANKSAVISTMVAAHMPSILAQHENNVNNESMMEQLLDELTLESSGNK